MADPEQHRPTRRMILRTGGAGVLVTLAAGAVLGGTAWWPGEASASEPWRTAGQGFGDVRLDALSYAILAPNPHNRQPWRYTLVGADQIDVTCDLDRRLPETDPYDRQITIGFGCMLELLRMAAASRGYRADIVAFPDGEPTPRLDEKRVATVHFVADAALDGVGARDPLAGYILERRSTKTPYDAARPVAAATLARLLTVGGGGSVEVAMVSRLRALTWAAWRVEWETARTRAESINLMRIGNAEIAANPDGISLGGTVMGLGGLVGVISRESLNDPDSSAFAQSAARFEPVIKSAQGHVWIISPSSSRAEQLEAGRKWVRVNLMAQSMGLAIHPLSQALQEFPEMAAHYAAVHDTLGTGTGEVVQMLARIGYADFPAPTPRWPMRSHLANQGG